MENDQCKSNVLKINSNSFSQTSIYPLIQFNLNSIFMSVCLFEPYILGECRGVRDGGWGVGGYPRTEKIWFRPFKARLNETVITETNKNNHYLWVCKK